MQRAQYKGRSTQGQGQKWPSESQAQPLILYSLYPSMEETPSRKFTLFNHSFPISKLMSILGCQYHADTFSRPKWRVVFSPLLHPFWQNTSLFSCNRLLLLLINPHTTTAWAEIRYYVFLKTGYQVKIISIYNQDTGCILMPGVNSLYVKILHYLGQCFVSPSINNEFNWLIIQILKIISCFLRIPHIRQPEWGLSMFLS